MSEVILAGTGHRPDKLGGEYDLVGPVTAYVSHQVDKHLDLLKPVKVISGMALGFDMILALRAFEKGIPVTAAIPFEGQESKWPPKSRALYHRILSNPLVTKWICAPGSYNPHKLQHRNRCMVDAATDLLACYDGSPGGTRNCVQYAFEVAEQRPFKIHVFSPKRGPP